MQIAIARKLSMSEKEETMKKAKKRVPVRLWVEASGYVDVELDLETLKELENDIEDGDLDYEETGADYDPLINALNFQVSEIERVNQKEK